MSMNIQWLAELKFYEVLILIYTVESTDKY